MHVTQLSFDIVFFFVFESFYNASLYVSQLFLQFIIDVGHVVITLSTVAFCCDNWL